MSFFDKIVEKLAGSSSPALQKVKDEAEQRRASKSSSGLPNVKGGAGIESSVASMLEKRIKSSEFSTKGLNKK